MLLYNENNITTTNLRVWSLQLPAIMDVNRTRQDAKLTSLEIYDQISGAA